MFLTRLRCCLVLLPSQCSFLEVTSPLPSKISILDYLPNFSVRVMDSLARPLSGEQDFAVISLQYFGLRTGLFPTGQVAPSDSNGLMSFSGVQLLEGTHIRSLTSSSKKKREYKFHSHNLDIQLHPGCVFLPSCSASCHHLLDHRKESNMLYRHFKSTSTSRQQPKCVAAAVPVHCFLHSCPIPPTFLTREFSVTVHSILTSSTPVCSSSGSPLTVQPKVWLHQ